MSKTKANFEYISCQVSNGREFIFKGALPHPETMRGVSGHPYVLAVEGNRIYLRVGE